MPTKSLGDLRLKHKEFNFHKYDRELGYRPPIENYSGNYVSHVPEVQMYELTESDKFVILASDGLWDELNRKQSAQLASEMNKNPESDLTSKTLSASLMNKALQHAAESSGVTRHFLGSLRPGDQKRDLVDDITIVVLDLEN